MRIALIIQWLLLIAVNLSSQNKQSANFQVKSFDGATISALAINTKSGDTIFSFNPKTRCIPASTLKLFTTATALETIGSEFRFKTQIMANGPIENSILKGNLTIINGGDPTLGSPNFPENSADIVLKSILQKLTEKGITKIEGKILVENNRSQPMEIPKGRVLDDVANYYGAYPNSLCWRDNCFTIYLKSEADLNSKCQIVGYDNLAEPLKFDCRAVASNKAQDSAYIYSVNGNYTIQGSIPLNQTRYAIKGATPSPSSQFLAELTSYLTKNSITVTNKKSTITHGKLDTLLTISSPTLQEIAKITNQKSNNLYADALFLAIGNDVKHPHIWDGTATKITNYWNPYLSSPIRIVDGSGLSIRNLLAANQLVDLLKQMHRSVNCANYQSTLAVAGVSGTLKNSFKSLKGTLYGKSGSMEGVLCYAGYYYNQKNEIIAFAFLINNFVVEPKEVKKDIELILKMME